MLSFMFQLLLYFMHTCCKNSKKSLRHVLYACSQDYGQTPEYLLQRREEVKKAQEEYDNYVKERMREGAMKQLSGEERRNILQVNKYKCTLNETVSNC